MKTAKTKSMEDVDDAVEALRVLAQDHENTDVVDAFFSVVDALAAQDTEGAIKFLVEIYAADGGPDGTGPTGEAAEVVMEQIVHNREVIAPMGEGARGGAGAMRTKSATDQVAGLIDEAIDAAGDQTAIDLLKDCRRAVDAGLWADALACAEDASVFTDVADLVDAIAYMMDEDEIGVYEGERSMAGMRTKYVDGNDIQNFIDDIISATSDPDLHAFLEEAQQAIADGDMNAADKSLDWARDRAAAMGDYGAAEKIEQAVEMLDGAGGLGGMNEDVNEIEQSSAASGMRTKADEDYAETYRILDHLDVAIGDALESDISATASNMLNLMLEAVNIGLGYGDDPARLRQAAESVIDIYGEYADAYSPVEEALRDIDRLQDQLMGSLPTKSGSALMTKTIEEQQDILRSLDGDLPPELSRDIHGFLIDESTAPDADQLYTMIQEYLEAETEGSATYDALLDAMDLVESAVYKSAAVETRGFGKKNRQEILTLHEGLQTWIAPYRDQFGPAIEWPARARDALIMDEWDDVEQMYRDAAEALRSEQEYANGMDADTASEIADKYEEFADDLSEMTAEFKSALGLRTKRAARRACARAAALTTKKKGKPYAEDDNSAGMMETLEVMEEILGALSDVDSDEEPELAELARYVQKLSQVIESSETGEEQEVMSAYADAYEQAEEMGASIYIDMLRDIKSVIDKYDWTAANEDGEYEDRGESSGKGNFFTVYRDEVKRVEALLRSEGTWGDLVSQYGELMTGFWEESESWVKGSIEDLGGERDGMPQEFIDLIDLFLDHVNSRKHVGSSLRTKSAIEYNVADGPFAATEIKWEALDPETAGETPPTTVEIPADIAEMYADEPNDELIFALLREMYEGWEATDWLWRDDVWPMSLRA